MAVLCQGSGNSIVHGMTIIITTGNGVLNKLPEIVNEAVEGSRTPGPTRCRTLYSLWEVTQEVKIFV